VPKMCQKSLDTVLKLSKYLSRPCSSAKMTYRMIMTMMCQLLLSKSHM